MRRHGWLSALFTLAALGCGAESGIFAEGEASGAGGSTSVGGAGGGTTSGTGGDPTTTGTGGDPTTTGTGGDPTTTGTGGASTTSSTGGGGSPPVLDCGAAACPADGSSACCWDNHLLYGPPQGECVTGNIQNDGCQTTAPNEPEEPGAETRIECQSSAHCTAGTTCCGELRQGFVSGQQIFFYESVTCQQNCDPQQSEVQLCDPGEATPCPGDLDCQQSQLLPTGYFVCADN